MSGADVTTAFAEFFDPLVLLQAQGATVARPGA